MGMVGWVVAVLLVALMLPLLAFMYLDILETRNDAKQQLEKVEKLNLTQKLKLRMKTWTLTWKLMQIWRM